MRLMTFEDATKAFFETATPLEMRAIGDFVGIRNSDTLSRWRRGKQDIGRGMTRIAIRHYLEVKGYLIEEIGKLPKLIQQLSRMIAYKILTVEDMRKELLYENSQEVYRVILGKGNFSGGRLKIAEDFVKKHGAALDTKVRAFRGEHAPPASPVAPASTSAPPVPALQHTSAPADPSVNEAVISGFVVLAKCLLPLAEHAASDAFSDNDRRKLRDRMNRDGIFKLHSALNALCSETARKGKTLT